MKNIKNCPAERLRKKWRCSSSRNQHHLLFVALHHGKKMHRQEICCVLCKRAVWHAIDYCANLLLCSFVKRLHMSQATLDLPALFLSLFLYLTHSYVIMQSNTKGLLCPLLFLQTFNQHYNFWVSPKLLPGLDKEGKQTEISLNWNVLNFKNISYLQNWIALLLWWNHVCYLVWNILWHSY